MNNIDVDRVMNRLAVYTEDELILEAELSHEALDRVLASEAEGTFLMGDMRNGTLTLYLDRVSVSLPQSYRKAQKKLNMFLETASVI